MKKESFQRRKDFRLESSNGSGEQFRAFARQNVAFPENLSIGLEYEPQDGQDATILIRCNGPHVEFNGEVDLFSNSIGLQQQKRVSHLLGQQALIVLDRQHIVGLLLDNLCGDASLTPYGVDGHHRSGQFQRRQQLGNRRDSVGFFIDLALSQHQTVALGLGRTHVDECLLAGLSRAAQCLA